MSDAVGSSIPLPRGRLLPLNSKRITSTFIRVLAKGLGLPTEASAEDLRRMIEGKLTEEDREPRNVQVLIQDTEGGGATRLLLQDENGIFLTLENVAGRGRGDKDDPEEPEQEVATGSPGDEEMSVEQLRQQLEEARKQNDALTADMQTCREDMEREKARTAELSGRIKEVWRVNCQQIAEYDAECAAKDLVISCLKRKIEELEARDMTAHSSTPSVTTEPSVVPVIPESPMPVPVVTRRGKAPPQWILTRVKTWKSAWMTGYQRWTVQLYGTAGLKRRS